MIREVVSIAFLCLLSGTQGHGESEGRISGHTISAEGAVEFQGALYYVAYFGPEVGTELARSYDGRETAELVYEAAPGPDDPVFIGIMSEPVVTDTHLYWISGRGTLYRYDGVEVSEVFGEGIVYNAKDWDWAPLRNRDALLAHGELLYITVPELHYAAQKMEAGLYLDDGNTVSPTTLTSFRWLGRDDDSAYVVLDDSSKGQQIYYQENNELFPISAELDWPLNWGNAPGDDESRQFFIDQLVYQERLVVFVRPVGDERPSWKAVTREGLIPFGPAQEGDWSWQFGAWTQGFYLERDSKWYIRWPDADKAKWEGLPDLSRIATTLDTDLFDLGSGWAWSSSSRNYYFYSELPYLYDDEAGAWYFYVWDETGGYYYDFLAEQWRWFSRKGTGPIEL